MAVAGRDIQDDLVQPLHGTKQRQLEKAAQDQVQSGLRGFADETSTSLWADRSSVSLPSQ